LGNHSAPGRKTLIDVRKNFTHYGLVAVDDNPHCCWTGIAGSHGTEPNMNVSWLKRSSGKLRAVQEFRGKRCRGDYFTCWMGTCKMEKRKMNGKLMCWGHSAQFSVRGMAWGKKIIECEYLRKAGRDGPPRGELWQAGGPAYL